MNILATIEKYIGKKDKKVENRVFSEDNIKMVLKYFPKAYKYPNISVGDVKNMRTSIDFMEIVFYVYDEKLGVVVNIYKDKYHTGSPLTGFDVDIKNDHDMEKLYNKIIDMKKQREELYGKIK